MINEPYVFTLNLALGGDQDQLRVDAQRSWSVGKKEVGTPLPKSQVANVFGAIKVWL